MDNTTFFLPWKLPGLNDYIAAERIHRQVAAKMKKEWTDRIEEFLRLKRVKKIKNPVSISIEWHEENARRDPDNIIFAKKFIFDGMKNAGVIINDNQKYILAIEESWVITPKKAGVRVSVVEYE